jgi:hypothetical protein
METVAMISFARTILMAIPLSIAGLSQPVYAVPTMTIMDTYIGSDSHGYGDVIGSTSNFQTNSMDVSLTGSVLSVSIKASFAGKGDDGLFSGYTAGGTGIGYGDLFLSSNWNPYGSAPYIGDDHSTGTLWTYGFSLDDRWMDESSVGTGTLYSLNSGSNDADILLAEDIMTGATYRNGQEVAVDTVNDDITAIAGISSWSIDVANSRVSFLIDLTGKDLLLGDDIALHWGFTCANDVIEGAYSVPEPGMPGLIGIGLLGMILPGRLRRKQ